MQTEQFNDRHNKFYMKKTIKFLVVAIFCVGLLSAFFYSTQVANAHFVKPKEKDRCPVCGMPPGVDPKTVAVIMYKDGKHAKFHGPKHMFTYYFNMGKYSQKYKQRDVAGMYVTEFYSLKNIKAQKAYFVIGSEIQGQTGEEIIPLNDINSAETFIKDHGGKILKFDEVTPEVIDNMKSMTPDGSSGSY
jgi:nitrous oxide reductase accessory protein NosL